MRHDGHGGALLQPEIKSTGRFSLRIEKAWLRMLCGSDREILARHRAKKTFVMGRLLAFGTFTLLDVVVSVAFRRHLRECSSSLRDYTEHEYVET